MRAAGEHLRRVEVRPVRRVDRHEPKRSNDNALTGDNDDVTRIAILGGGPAGYEAALVASQLGAEVVVIERDGIGGACVLADCVPSKTWIATSESMSASAGSEAL